MVRVIFFPLVLTTRLFGVLFVLRFISAPLVLLNKLHIGVTSNSLPGRKVRLRFWQINQDALQSAGHWQPPDTVLPPRAQGYVKQAMLSRLSRPPLAT
ncbi:hypothetical protein BJV78DRAFT_521873 [Lactifluus subvellereus]|nr:hypothetical protein BJV78DRAFT_521873 [Lactifluus subvellereus]